MKKPADQVFMRLCGLWCSDAQMKRGAYRDLNDTYISAIGPASNLRAFEASEKSVKQVKS